MGRISIICSLSPLAKQNLHYEYSWGFVYCYNLWFWLFYLNQLGHTVAKQTGWAAKADLAGLK